MKGILIDTSKIDLRREDLSYLLDIVKNRQYEKDEPGNPAANGEELDMLMRLRILIQTMIAGLDKPRKMHWLKRAK